MARIQFKRETINTQRQVAEEGMYTLALRGFTPKPIIPKDGTDVSPGVNYNPILEILSKVDGSPAPTRTDGKPLRVFFSAPTTWQGAVEDFCHAFGLPLEDDGNGNVGLPGIWDPQEEQDVTKCTYRGPLLDGRTAQAFLVKTTYNGQEKNEIKYFVCKVPNCAQKFPKLIHVKSFQRSTTKK
jgi:hypothetical protein